MLAAPAAEAASFAVDEGSLARRDARTGAIVTRIRITGAIEDGDAERLRAILTRISGTVAPGQRGGRVVAELSSNGGDVYAGLNIGYLFKEYDVATVVRMGDLCLSACALAFLGGTSSHAPLNLVPDRSIEVGGQVGFHNFVINPNSSSLSAATDASSGLVIGFSLARGGSSLLVRYAAAMSLDPAFIARLLGRPPETWEYIDTDGEFVDLTSCATGIERPAISPSEIATNICNHATGELNPVTASEAHELTIPEARRHLLEYVRHNMQELGVQGTLAKQIATAMASRNERQQEAVYEDLRAVGISLPQLQGPTFEVTGYSAGSYMMQCHVSYSQQDPDRYDLAIQGPGGLTKAFKSAPPKCARLFLFDRNDVLNPQKK
jgi:hypothetical protein